MKRLKSKTSKRLIVYIILFSSLLTFILTAIQLRMDYNNGISIIHQKISQIKLTNIDSITQSLWTMDHSSIEIQLTGISRINDIIYAEIKNPEDKKIATAGTINTSNTITEKIPLQQNYRDRNISLGTLTVVATKENVYQHLIDTVIVILISQAVKTFLVSLFIFVLFYYLITRHLKKIAEHSDNIKLTSPPTPLILDRKKIQEQDNDELDQVVHSINTMAENIYSAYNELLNNQYLLSDREAKLSSIFNAITDSVIFADKDRKIIQINPAFQTQFGYTQEEMVNETTFSLYANPEEFSQQGQLRYNDKTKPKPSLYEIEYRRKDGSTFASETMGGAVNLPDGTQIGLLGIIRDITSRKQDEAEKYLLQKQLQQTQKMEAIGQLTGGIAHDFNNILASMLGYTELTMQLLKDSDDPRLIKYITNINKGGERARELVIQMLAFSRNVPSVTEAINLPDLIDDVISIIRPTIPSSININIKMDEQVPEVLMDNTQMHQILMNLCINGRDAIGGHGTLTIGLSHDTHVSTICSSCNETVQGEYVKLTVEDNGTGIQKDIMDKIFEPFLTTKDVGKGTGMGLSVVHGILHKHDSHIIVDTEAGRGSRFQLLIPPINENKITATVKQADNKTAPNSKHDIHILVVDDEESVATFLQDFLQSENFKVTVTTSSKQAVDFIKNSTNNFDLIITDQTMPEMTGTEMVKEILNIRPDMPIILTSGYNEHVDEKEALQLGCSKYLGKPIRNDILLQSINEIFASKAD